MAGIMEQNPDTAVAGKLIRQPRHLPSLRSVLLLWIPATIAAGLVLLPIFYLALRATSSDTSLWDALLRIKTLETIGRTLWLALAVTTGSTAIAVPLAWLTVRTDLPLRRLWAILTPLPLVIPSYVGAYLMVSTIGPKGLFQNWLVGLTGVERFPEIYGFPGAMLILTLLSYPFVLLSTRAALLNMDPELEEAAHGLGMNTWRTFWRVIFPQLRPAIAAGGLLVALYALRDFGAVSIMRYDTFTRIIYISYQSSFDRSFGAALGLVLVSLAIMILALELWTRGRGRYYSSAKSRKPLVKILLGRWRWPALIFCVVVVGLSVVIPSGILVYWLGRGLQAGEQISSLWMPVQNSVLGSALAAGGTILAALPIAIVFIRYPNLMSRILERITYLAFALPGIVIALALVFFGANYALPLYQTLPLLVLAYIVLFLPEAVGALQTSLLQMHPSMEEAGLSLGRTPLNVFRKITLPLIRPGMIAAAGLVFLTTMKELPATLILSPFGFKTLATDIWGNVSEAFFAQAAAPALVLILVSSLPMAAMIIRDIKGSSLPIKSE
jgi:iron(III) transport system permease protein